MKADNPFTLTYGRKPGKYIERYEDTANIVDIFASESLISQTYLISGIRGSGKTVLMTTVSKELFERGGWIVVDINPSFDLLDDLANRLYDECRHGLGLDEKSFNISIAGFAVGVSSKSRQRDAVSRIEELLRFIQKKKKRVLITVDEVIHNDGIRSFISQFQIFIRKDYPIFLLMTGLYENIYSIQNDSSLTFLLRSPKVFLGPLSMHQIVSQYREVFDLDLDAAKELASITNGYAFAFQAFGFLYWEYRDQLSLEQILIKLDAMLDDYVYKKIWDSLSDLDKSIVLDISEHGMSKVADLRNRIDMSSASFSKYRERLINKGVISVPSHGYVDLSLPRFREIVQTYI